MSKITHKTVVIPHNGPIYPKGAIHGPIHTPYKEDIRTIGILLMNGYKVTEVLSEELRLELNIQNFDTDNMAVLREEQQAQREVELAAKKAEQEAAQALADETARLAAEEAERQEAAETARRKSDKQAQEQKAQSQQKSQKNPNKQRPQESDDK